MKSKYIIALIVSLFFLQGCAAVTEGVNQFTSPSIETEEALVSCPPSNTKPTLAVMNFEIKAGYGARGTLADGMSDMLVNALVETQCYRVVERSRMKDLLREQSLGLGGTIDPSSAASVGKLTGAQLLVMGTVTEFKENESGGAAGAFIKKIASGVGMTSAHIGLIIRIVDATRGEILLSKSVDKKVNKIGFAAGGSVFGVPMGGGVYKSKAMQDAVEQAIIETVGIIASQTDVVTSSTGLAQSGQQRPMYASSSTDCSQIAGPVGPTFMVVIPEVHITRRVPDPAGETEIIRKFLEKGLSVVDQQQIDAIRYQETVTNAVKNPRAAASLGAEFGADIIVVGEAFSEYAGREQRLFSCRARVEARAIQTSTGRILAAHGTHAGGADISELVAGKAALRNAGSKLADYFISQFCQGENLAGAGQSSAVEIQVTNINFRQMQKFVSMLEVLPGTQRVEKRLTGNTARLRVHYNGDSDELASMIQNRNTSGLRIDITGLSVNKINLTVTGEGAPQGSATSNREMIRQIQRYLNKLGYSSGNPDGVMGDKTAAAIKNYQRDVDMTADGKATNELLESLRSHF